MKEAERRVFVAQANLVALGLIDQTENGMRPTEKGLQKAAEIWDNLPDESKLLLVPYLRKHLNLMFREEQTE